MHNLHFASDKCVVISFVFVNLSLYIVTVIVITIYTTKNQLPEIALTSKLL